MKNLMIFVVVATILAVSGLGYTFITSEANRKSDDNLNMEIQAISSDLTSLQNKLTTLNGSLTQISENLGDLDADLQREIVSIQANVSSLATRISGLRNNVSAIQKDISDIRTDITSLNSNVTTFSTQISNIQEDISTIQTLITNLQSNVSNLEARVSTLESKRSLVIRIWFLSFEPDSIPATGKDYLFDVKLSWGPGIESYVYGRTGHSRFVAPNYIDLSANRTLMGSTVEITIYAYWHADDILIDINGDTADYHLVRTYQIGTIFQETVNGNNDNRGILLDPYDAIMTYKIETLP